MARWKIYNDDVVHWASTYNKGKFHALLCDPPYHLTTIVKRFGKKGSAPAKFGTDGVFARSSAGFMGQEWDGGDIAFRPETWAAFHDVLFPGAFGMAFSASRNWHRLAVAIEDAGYIIHPTIFLWAQGQGFPKATNISKQLIHADAESEDSEIWKGHRYGLQALKPAVEPIIVFQKPYEGKPLENITDTGAGALNIDDARIPTGEPVTINRFTDGAKPWGNGAGHKYETEMTSQGRWPSNLILGGEATAHLGEPSKFFYAVQDKLDESDPVYYCGKVSRKEREAGIDKEKEFMATMGDGIGKREHNESEPNAFVKNSHPTLKPIDLSRYLATLLLPPEEYKPRRIVVPFSGAGSEMIGAGLAGWEQIVGIEFDKENGYVNIAEQRLEHWLK